MKKYHCSEPNLVEKSTCRSPQSFYARVDSLCRAVTDPVFKKVRDSMMVPFQRFGCFPFGIDYSDATPDITFTYDRLGRKKTVSDAAGNRTFVYNADLQRER